MKAQQQQVCRFWTTYGSCKKGDKCDWLHPAHLKGNKKRKDKDELTEEKMKEIAEDYLAKKKKEELERREKLSSIGQVKGQQENDVYDDVYGDSNMIAGGVEEDDVYMGDA